MAVHKLYIQQTNFDGIDYTKGTPIDTLETYSVVCREFPFKLYPESKDVTTKDMKGLHGVDVYIPSYNRIKDYEMEVQFLYLGTHANMRTDIDAFLKFINGMNGGVDESAVGARLAIYDQYTQIGRKDLRVVSTEFGGYWDMPDYDTDAIADFKVKFHVYDPVTDVTPITTNNALDLVWN